MNLLQVIRDRKWKEVIAALNFPSTITSASFVVRKYYLSLIYHFEQVYFFRKEIPSIPLDGMPNLSLTYYLCCFKFLADSYSHISVYSIPQILQAGVPRMDHRPHIYLRRAPLWINWQVRIDVTNTSVHRLFDHVVSLSPWYFNFPLHWLQFKITQDCWNCCCYRHCFYCVHLLSL